MDIREALAELDPANDDDWTTEGLPRIETLTELMGEAVTRKQIVEAAPRFTRTNDEMPGDEPAKAVAPAKSETTPVEEPKKTKRQPKVLAKAQAEAKAGEARYLELGEKIFELQQERATLEGKMTELMLEQSRLQRFAPSEAFDHKADQEARMVFIKSQTKIRAEKAGKLNTFLASAAAAAGKSPLDQAMARKTARGTQRPNFQKS